MRSVVHHRVRFFFPLPSQICFFELGAQPIFFESGETLLRSTLLPSLVSATPLWFYGVKGSLLFPGLFFSPRARGSPDFFRFARLVLEFGMRRLRLSVRRPTSRVSGNMKSRDESIFYHFVLSNKKRDEGPSPYSNVD